jgi:hypothetical protein
MENDLWDLDDDLSSAARPEKSREGSLPSRRIDDSSIQSRTPVERKTEAPITKKITARLDTEKTASSNEADPESSVKDSSPVDKTSKTSKTAEPNGNFFGSLSKIEKISIALLVAILALTATFTLIHFSNEVPLKPLIAEQLDFPIEGKLITVTSLETYWREPITRGDDADVVRRGVKLIPTIRIGIEGSSGAIRVLFRNESETVVGDNISRQIEKDGIIEITATDGFEDIGMHAAYRTGEGERWTVQVLEGPSIGAPREKFRTLLETEISTDVR